MEPGGAMEGKGDSIFLFVGLSLCSKAKDSFFFLIKQKFK